MKWYERRWVLMLIFIAVVEVPLYAYRSWWDAQFDKPSPYPGETAVYRSLAGNPARYGRVAQWAHQFMRIEDALDLARREGYRCPAQTDYRGAYRCSYRDWLELGAPHIELGTRSGFLASAKGFWYAPGLNGARGYFEVVAPGYEFADAAAWLGFLAQHVRVRERGDPVKVDFARPLKSYGYGQLLDELRRQLNMACSNIERPGEPVPETRCETRSLAGQSQVATLRLSSETGAPAALEASLGSATASIALIPFPSRNSNGEDEVLVREPGQAFRTFAIGDQPLAPRFSEKFATRFAVLDEPSRRRVLRVIAGQLDERFKSDEDDALRPVLQQIDFGALYVRRAGAVRDAHDLARAASLKTYASFAVAECDGLSAGEARACFDRYANARPELRALMADAMREVRALHPSPDPRGAIARRLALLQSFAAP